MNAKEMSEEEFGERLEGLPDEADERKGGTVPAAPTPGEQVPVSPESELELEEEEEEEEEAFGDEEEAEVRRRAPVRPRRPGAPTGAPGPERLERAERAETEPAPERAGLEEIPTEDLQEAARRHARVRGVSPPGQDFRKEIARIKVDPKDERSIRRKAWVVGAASGVGFAAASSFLVFTSPVTGGIFGAVLAPIIGREYFRTRMFNRRKKIFDQQASSASGERYPAETLERPSERVRETTEEVIEEKARGKMSNFTFKEAAERGVLKPGISYKTGNFLLDLFGRYSITPEQFERFNADPDYRKKVIKRGYAG